ncbi:MAG TPA: J domain-containing protein [Vicinamibacterales bacterium]|nr:J domain-containing protein [Vicinamibacterales bacterium]
MDYYNLLGLAPGASISDVKRAYRRLSRRYHPGINPGDRAAEALFQRITEAYETLSDADRRRQYDTAGAVGAGGSRTDQVFEFSGFDFSVAAQGPAAATFSELFAEALHPVPPQDAGRSQAGADIHASVSLLFEEAMTGVDRQLIVTRQVPCGACRGAGQVRAADAKCVHCHGSGTVRWARGHMVFTKGCTACGATGRERHRRCTACGGHGRSVRSEAVTVHIPAGVADGTQLRIAERGHAGAHGGRPGDLFVDLQVRPHPVLRRDHDDLHLIAPVAVHEAALGARIEVPSFDGPVRLKIPPGTQAGQRLRVSGRGAPSMTGGRGDLFVEVRLTLPPIVDERSKELMKEFARLNPTDVRRDWQKQFGAEG